MSNLTNAARNANPATSNPIAQPAGLSQLLNQLGGQGTGGNAGHMQQEGTSAPNVPAGMNIISHLLTGKRKSKISFNISPNS